MINADNFREALSFIGIFVDESVYSWIPLVIGILVFSILVIIVNALLSSFRSIKEYAADGIMLQIKGPHTTARLLEKIKKIHEILYLEYRNKRHISIEIVLKKENTYLFLYIPVKIRDQVRELFKETEYQVDEVPDTLLDFFDAAREKGQVFMAELEKDFIWPLNFERKQSSFRKSLSIGDYVYLQILIRPLSSKWGDIVRDYKNQLLQGKDPMEEGGLKSLFQLFRKPKVEPDIALSQQNQISAITQKDSQVGFEFGMRGIVTSKTNQEQLLYSHLQDLVHINQEYGNRLVFTEQSKRISSSTKPDFLLRFLDRNTVDILNDLEVARLLEYLYN